MEVIMGGITTIFYFAIVVAAMWKLFQIASDLSQIKTTLIEMRQQHPTSVPKAVPPVPARASQPPELAGPISLESAEALLREVAAESQALEATERPHTNA